MEELFHKPDLVVRKEQLRFIELSVRTHFGNDPAEVVKTILTFGPLSLNDVVKRSGLPVRLVKTSLMVLIQHGIIIADRTLMNLKQHQEGAEPVIATLYTMDFATSDYRANAARFIVKSREKFGNDADYLMEVMCEQGRLQKKKIVELALGIKVLREKKDAAQQAPTDRMKSSMNATFEKMAAARFFIRAQALVTDAGAISAALAQKHQDETDKKYSRSRKKPSITSPSVAGKKRGRPGESATPAPVDTKSPAKKGKTGKATAAVDPSEQESKSKATDRLKGLMDGDPLPIEDNTDPYWVINFPLLVSHIRIDFITEYVEGRFGATHANLVRVIMESYIKSTQQGVLAQDLAEIERLLPGDTQTIGIKNVEQLLMEMVRDALPVVRRTSGRFQIAVDEMIAHLKLEHVKVAVKKNMGPIAARALSIIEQNGMLEEKELLEFMATRQTDSKAALLKLLKSAYVYVQDIPKSSDRNPRSTAYLWGLNKQHAFNTFVDSVYFMWSNVKERLEHENSVVKPLSDKIRLQSASQGLAEDEKELYQKHIRISEQLEVMGQNVASLVLLFKYM